VATTSSGRATAEHENTGPGPVFRFVRHYARKPAVRRVIQPVLARAYRLRNSRLSVRGRWQKAHGWEVAYWKEWLTTPEAQRLLDPDVPLDDDLVMGVVASMPDRSVSILDVGAGPITPLGRRFAGKQIEVIATDALAKEYDAVLEQASIRPPVRTQLVEAERLAETFPAGSIDIAHCRNALDHCYDPVLALDNMLAVVRPGGYVLLNHFINEGSSQGYLGLHQWNLTERDGSFVIWNAERDENISERFTGHATIECRTVEGDDSLTRLYCYIRKHEASDSSASS
jgi:SAM-dependent methyltransferase